MRAQFCLSLILFLNRGDFRTGFVGLLARFSIEQMGDSIYVGEASFGGASILVTSLTFSLVNFSFRST